MTYAQDTARTALQQIGNRRLTVLKPSMITYDDKGNGNVDLQFLIGGNTRLVRKIRVSYQAGQDLYEVRSYVSTPMFMTTNGTSMGINEKYSAEGVYADSLGDVVIAAARAAGARPRI